MKRWLFVLTALLMSGVAMATIYQGTTGNDTLYGTSASDEFYGREGNDTLYGQGGDDRLEGNAGNDTLYGGAGDDIYWWGLGDGNDVVRNTASSSDADALAFGPGISAGDVVLSRSTDNLVVTHAPSGQWVQFVQNFSWTSNDNELDLLSFDGGGSLTRAQIRAALLVATSGNDTLKGYETADILDGLAGADTLYGGPGDDELRGGAGNDRLYGGNGDDLLLDGPGSDNLYGELGSDVYAYAAANEELLIWEPVGNAGDTDELHLLDLLPSQVGFSRSGSALKITVAATGAVITINGWYAPTPQRVEKVVFADSSYLTDAQISLLAP